MRHILPNARVAIRHNAALPDLTGGHQHARERLDVPWLWGLAISLLSIRRAYGQAKQNLTGTWLASRVFTLAINAVAAGVHFRKGA